MENVRGHKRPQIDMLHGPLLKKILLFALPLALSGILQQLFNSADVAVIGWFEDSAAQAAVNSNGPLINLLINLFTGLSVGVTVVIAEYIGKDQKDDVHSVVLTAAVIAATSGMFLLLVGVFVAGPVLRLMDVPSDVLPLAASYLQVYFIGMPFVMIYNFGAAILLSIGDTRRPLYSLSAAGVANIGLNVLFVAVFHMSVVGVATATVISDAISAVCVSIFVMRDDTLRIRPKKSKIRAVYLKRIIAIGLPAGLQGTVFSISNVIIQTAINSFGDKAMAGSGDTLYFELYVYYFVSAFAQACVTFIGQNYAAGEYERCKKIFRLSMYSSLAITTVLSLTFTLGGRLFIRIYTSDEEAIRYALIRMWCVLVAEMMPCIYEISGGALRGIGHSLLPALITVIGSCVLRVIWVYAVLPFSSGEFYMLMIVYPISWAVTGAAMMAAYFLIAGKAYKRDVLKQKNKNQGDIDMRKNFGAKTWLYPMPVFIIATYGDDGTPDAMNAAWGGMVESETIGLCLSESHKTTQNILKRRAFTVSIADAKNVIAEDYVGIVSGNDEPKKFEKAGFTATKSAFVDAPVINEIPMALECEYVKTTEDGLVIGRIVNVSADESVLSENGKIDPAKFRPIAFDPVNNKYLALGEAVGNAFSDGAKLK